MSLIGDFGCLELFLLMIPPIKKSFCACPSPTLSLYESQTSSAPLCFRLCCCCNDDVSWLGNWTECWPDHVPRSCQISLHFPLRPSFPPHIFMFLFLIYFIFLTSSAVSQPRSAPIYSLIFSPTRRSPFINLGKLWSPNYFSFIMNDRFWTRYNLPIGNKMN